MLIRTLYDYETLENHVLLMGGASRYFAVMISTDTYLTILCSLWYYVGLFPSWYLVVWVCTSSTSQPTKYSYTSLPGGQCAHSWVVCRIVQHIQPCSDWKAKPKPMSQCIYERIGPTILHMFHFPTLTVRLLIEYLLKYSNHVLLLFSCKGKTPIYRWQRLFEGQGTKVKVVAFMLFLMILRLDKGTI